VTDAYRLSRGGRLRTDLGGVYFNALFVLALGGIYAATGIESLLLAALLVHFEMAHQLLPFLRLDGYYIVADLVGVPDLFQRIRPILSSFLPWRETDPRVGELKPWVRFVVTGWVLVVLPIIVVQVLLVVTVTPRLLGTAWDSVREIWTRATGAFSDERWLEGVGAVVQLLLLVLPLAGIAYLFWMLGVRFVRGWRATKGRPAARGMLSLTGIAFLAFVTLAWWPDETRYAPIRPGERWTLPVVAAAATDVPLGGTGSTRIDPGRSVDPSSAGAGGTGVVSPSAPPGGTSTSLSATPTPSPTASPSVTASPTPSASPSVVSPSASPTP